MKLIRFLFIAFFILVAVTAALVFLFGAQNFTDSEEGWKGIIAETRENIRQVRRSTLLAGLTFTSLDYKVIPSGSAQASKGPASTSFMIDRGTDPLHMDWAPLPALTDGAYVDTAGLKFGASGGLTYSLDDYVDLMLG